MTSIGELRRRTLEELTRPSYSLARSDMVLLNDNANLFGANPAVMEVAREFDFSRLWAYPSENSDALRARIASEFGLSPDEVIVGNGSDEILDMSSKAFLNPGEKLCTPAPTFSMYKFYARMNLGRVVEKMLLDDFSLDADAVLSEGAKITAICQPNNPTANLFEGLDVARVIDEASGVVLVDEAYADFCGSSTLGDVMESERAIDIRTFSKAYGIAGLRVGFAVARREVIDELRSVRTPFGLNSFAEAVAIAALDNKAWKDDVVRRVRGERERLAGRLRAMGFKVYPSECNFLLCDAPVNGPRLVSKLREKGIAIRDLDRYPLLGNHVRITVAPREMMDALLDALESALPECGR
jgi:histidinol-phosphate aminotransferase